LATIEDLKFEGRCLKIFVLIVNKYLLTRHNSRTVKWVYTYFLSSVMRTFVCDLKCTINSTQGYYFYSTYPASGKYTEKLKKKTSFHLTKRY